jgi:hypothetical protein
VVTLVPRTPLSVKGAGCVYYTDHRADPELLAVVQQQLLIATKGLPIVSATIHPLDFGHNVTLPAGYQPGIRTMFKQILLGLETLDTEYAFLVEHDLLYHPSHFEFRPSENEAFFYNENTWKVDYHSGHAVFYYCKQTSGLCANRQLLVEHYRKRIAKIDQNAADLRSLGLPIKRDGFSQHMGFEPGCHAYPRGVDHYPAKRWMSAEPNIDLRHGKNLTPTRWKQDQFRDPRSCQGWLEAESVPGWGKLADVLKAIRDDVQRVRA